MSTRLCVDFEDIASKVMFGPAADSRMFISRACQKPFDIKSNM